MTLQAPQRRKTALNSDALTGEWLVPGSPRYIVRIPSKRQRPRYLEAGHGEPLSAPLTLHTSTTDAGGLGGLMYHQMMARYLGYAVDAQQRAERLALLAWWRSDYGVNRVRLGLMKRLPPQTVQHVLEVVLACHREQADPADIAVRFGHSEQWVRAKIDWCMHAAQFHRATCACVGCEQRRSS